MSKRVTRRLFQPRLRPVPAGVATEVPSPVSPMTVSSGQSLATTVPLSPSSVERPSTQDLIDLTANDVPAVLSDDYSNGNMFVKSFSAVLSTRPNFLIAVKKSKSLSIPPRAVTEDVESMLKKICRKIQGESGHYGALDSERAECFFLLPRKSSHPNDWQRAYQIMGNIINGQHMSTSTADLQFAMDLRQSLESSTLPDNCEAFYIRTWSLTKSDLQDVLVTWAEDEREMEESYSWLVHPAFAGKPDEVVHIRYIGKCRGPITPYMRLQDDNRLAIGTMGAFLQALLQVAPDVFAAGESYEFTHARLNERASESQRDRRERQLIALFGKSTLLNRQSGGHYAYYVPSLEDQNAFTRLHTNFFDHFEQTATPPAPDSELENGIKIWIDHLQAFADAFPRPDETATAYYPLTDAHIRTMVEQATPFQAYNHTLITIVGKDVTRTDFLSPDPPSFLESPGKGPVLVQRFLKRYHAEEHGIHQWEDYDGPPISFFPMVNVFPWLGHGLVQQCLELVAEYLRSTRPLITVVLGKLVASGALSNYYHTCAVPGTADFVVDVVGLPVIRHYAPGDWLDDNAATAAPAGYETLVIPHIDPGYDKYADQDDSLRAIMDMTWIVTLYAGHVALNLLATHHGNDTVTERERLVRAIFEAVCGDGSSPEIRAVFDPHQRFGLYLID